MQRTFLLLPLLCFTQMLFAQISFTDGSSLLGDPGFRSYQAIAIIDMNGDGRDDIVRAGLPTSGSNVKLNIEYQNSTGGVFGNYQCGNCTFGAGEPYSLVVGDINKNGYNDILYGGNATTVKYLKASSTGYTPVNYFANSNIRGLNFVDFDKDSDLDAFGCNNDGLNVIFENQGGGLSLNNGLLPTEPSGGNNASVWTDIDNDGDLDFYISRSKVGETNPAANSRLNRLYINNGGMSFTESAAALGIQNGGQTRASAFADIDNDGDLDLFVLNTDGGNELYEQMGNPLVDPRNNGLSSGNFTPIISGSGINVNGAGALQAMFTDFDHDGNIDLLIAGSSPTLYRNNGDKTFTAMTFPAMSGMKNMALGDFNNDGFTDIYATSSDGGAAATPDKIFLNDGNVNNYMCFRLEGTLSNPNAIGARLLFYGDWGVQVQEIQAGESFGVQNSTTQRFGMGNKTDYDSLVIHWSSGPKQWIPGSAFPNNFCHFIREGHPILSVELVTFEATLGDGTVLLGWETASEERHDHFEVQRSVDGIEFRAIGEVYEADAEGTFSQYSFVDERPELGYNYYRLRIIDEDGMYEYSDIRVVKTEFRTQVNISPNPIIAGQQLSVQVIMPESMNNPELQYELFDLAGRQMLLENLSPSLNSTEFDLESFGLTPGVYFLRFTFDGKYPETHKFMVTH